MCEARPTLLPPPSGDLHTDLGQRVVLHAADALWQPSAQPGVQRRLLECWGGGHGRTTSLVRYAPGARTSVPVHAGGEEILVLEGMFSDDTGDHPTGTYLRRPPGRRHALFSAAGCLLYVKQGHFAADDTAAVRIDICRSAWRADAAPGLWTLPLHSHAGTETLLVRAVPHTWFDTHSHPGGEELLVLEGVLHDDLGRYPRHSWTRSPRWSRHAPHTMAEGAMSLVKLGHLGPAPRMAAAKDG